MSKFKDKGSKKTPGTSTAALPDIVFMLLFFFMVTTVMKEKTAKVRVELPKGTEISKLSKDDPINYVYIGKSLTPEEHGAGDRIQLDDDIVPNELAVREWIRLKRDNIDENKLSRMMTNFKVDKYAKMITVNKVKEQLREMEALKISYSANEKK